MPDDIKRWISTYPAWMLTLVTIAVLLPFLAKPFNIDDPLFIWTAKQIQSHPTNPYGFNVNWYGSAEPMWRVTENPPLACYFLAGAAKIFGWSEIALHFVFLLPAVAAVLGTYRLAKQFCKFPALAALMTLFTPVVLVSSMTVMCDIPTLAFWVWAVVFWVEGLQENNRPKLFFAALLVSLASMTKYYGACLVPLLAVYSLFGKAKWRALFILLIPLAILALYEWLTELSYGRGLLFLAVYYTQFAHTYLGFSKISTGLTALAFTGGCLAIAVFLLLCSGVRKRWRCLLLFQPFFPFSFLPPVCFQIYIRGLKAHAGRAWNCKWYSGSSAEFSFSLWPPLIWYSGVKPFPGCCFSG